MPYGIPFSAWWAQTFPPKARFTEKNVSSLEGKVYIVTGSNIGIGKALSQILYSKNARVYIAARSKEKALRAIEDIKAAAPDSKGELIFLNLDLADLTTIKSSADEFLAKEKRLHVLFNNAGVAGLPPGSKTAQGYEAHLGINNLGTFMFTKLLTSILLSTAQVEKPSTVRVIWLSSCATEYFTPKNAGVPMDNLDYHKEEDSTYKYAVSKAGNYLHAVEYAKRYKKAGVVSVAINPGNLRSGLLRHQTAFFQFLLYHTVQYPTIKGAYTEFFAGLSPDVSIERSGEYVGPWGRIVDIRADLVTATKTEAEGGTGVGLKFWDWTEEQIGPYVG